MGGLGREKKLVDFLFLKNCLDQGLEANNKRFLDFLEFDFRDQS